VDEKHEPAALQSLFSFALKPLLKQFPDSVEKIREMCVELVTDLMNAVPSPEAALPYLMPVIVMRLGQKEIEEESEEVRLLMVNLLNAVVARCPKASLPLYLDDYVTVLTRTIVDPYADVKKQSCACLCGISAACPEQFLTGSKPLHKPLIATIGHQHSRVRVAAIQAIESLCLYGAVDAINDFMLCLAQKSMDQAPTVRRALYKAVGHWLVDLKDRYSFWYKLLTLMLNGINDEVEEIQKLCTDLWHAAGRQWEQENEDDIKDMLDFGKSATDPTALPLGCRILVERELCKILPGLLKDMCDWTTQIRMQSAKLLLSLLEYAESKSTIHIEKLLGGYYTSVRDEEPEIAEVVVKCAEMTGKYTAAATWITHTVPRLGAKQISSSEQVAQLIVLGSLIRGAGKGPQVAEVLPDIAEALASEDVCGVPNPELLDELIVLVGDMLDACAEVTPELSRPLFDAMVNARAVSGHMDREFTATMTRLAEMQGLDLQGLYSAHTPALLQVLKGTHRDWNKHSHHRAVFDALLLRAGTVLGDEVETVMEIFHCNFHVDKDPELRLSFFALLGKLFTTASGTLNATGKFDFSERVMSEIVVPNCIWVNGRVPAAIRTAAAACFWALLRSGLVKQEHYAKTIALLLPQVQSCVDDEYPETRMTFCKILEMLLLAYPEGFNGGYESYDRLHILYPDLLKRLDDNDDVIRLVVLRTWLAYAKCISTKKYDTQLYKVHLDAICKGILIHLDDPDKAIQDAVMAVLKELAPVNPSMVASLAAAAKSKHRHPQLCEELEKFAKAS